MLRRDVKPLVGSDLEKASAGGTGIQSIEVGSALLRVLAGADGPMPLTQLAAVAGMPPGKAHKYLVSYTRIGLVTRARGGSGYDLGPFALELGLASLRRGDLMTLAQDAIGYLRDCLGTTASVAVWANRGVTLVRWAETPHITSPTIRLGTVLPMLPTATGRVFGAYLQPRISMETIRRELADATLARLLGNLTTMEQVQTLFAQVRGAGFASCEGIPEIGHSSMAAPILNANHDIVAALAIVGVQGVLDVTEAGVPAKELCEQARAISMRLGARP